MSVPITEKPVLAVFTENDFDRQALCLALQSYFSDFLAIEPAVIATAAQFQSPPRAVIVNKTSCKVAAQYFPKSKIIYAQRFLTGSNVEQLISLPTGKTVLVMNKPREIAEETVQDLLALGVNHLELVPGWPDSDLDAAAFDTAAFAGFRSYCPPGLSQYIDLGYRSLSQSTLVEIMRAYDLPSALVDKAQFRFGQVIVEGLYRTEAVLRETRAVKSTLEQVCSLSKNAILTMDAAGTVLVCNPAAEVLLGLRAAQAVGRPWHQLLSPFPQLMQLIRAGGEASDELIYISGAPVLATLHPPEEDGRQGVIVSLIPVESLQSSDEKARSDLHRRGFRAKYTFEDIQGSSPALLRAVLLGRYYAASDATVLITGESGTGKELFAQAIHNQSGRAKAPFVGVNFAAIPESLMESELFGYDEGAFTGAARGGKPGLFRSAHMGTIFLDEIGDASPSMQSRLLRVLEEREVMPVGSSRVIPVEVRILCATNKDLPAMVARGEFREDLYYRLKVFQLQIPPLRQRREDIPLLLERLSGASLPAWLRERFLAYDWPGNIRELRSIAKHLTLVHSLPEWGADAPELWGQILDNFFEPGFPPPAQAKPLREEAVSREDLAVLSCIQAMEHEHRPAGRYSLAHLPELTALGMTESRLKLRLGRLAEAGYLLIGKTRQGVTLTSKGRDLLER